MLGEKIGEGSGKITGQRVLPNAGGLPKTESSVQITGTLLGVENTLIGTYESVMRPDGTLFGEGQGIVTGKGGEVATLVGRGAGKIKEGGAVSFRGAFHYHATSPPWSRLNDRAVVFEWDVDRDGNVRFETWEWV